MVRRKTKQSASPRKRFVRKRFFVGGVFLVFVALLVQQWHQFFLAHSRYVPASGGILTEVSIGVVRNISPLADNHTLVDRDIISLIHAGLVRYNPETGQIEDALAEFRTTQDPKVYRLTLKETAAFSDGTPVTIKDVLFTYEKVIQTPAFSNDALREAFEYVTIDVLDEKTLTFNLPEQNVFFPYLLTTPILPAHVYEGALIEEINDPGAVWNRSPVGAGIMRLRSIVPSDDGTQRIFLERNPHYYAGAAHISQMVITVYPDYEALLLATPEAQADIISHVPFSLTDNFEKNLSGSYRELSFLLPRYSSIFFNLEREQMDHLPLRQALRQSVEKQKILEKNWIPQESPFFFDGADVGITVTDFSGARVQLRDNGYPYNEDMEQRTKGRDGEPLKLTFVTSASPAAYSRFAQKIARTWERELDIEVELKVLDEGSMREVLQSRDYDILLFGVNFSQNADMLSIWHSSNAGEVNLSDLTNDDIDFLIDEIRFSGAPSDLFLLAQKLDDILPAMVLATPEYTVFLRDDVFGLPTAFGKLRTHADRYFGLGDWHFYQELDWDYPRNRSKVMGFLSWLFIR